jgi:hypothetical protein
MKIPRGRIKLPIEITSDRELTKEDLKLLEQPRAKPSRITRIRNSHHRVALLLSYGLSYDEVATATGYSYARIATLAIDPTIQELSAKYQEKRPEKIKELADEVIRQKLELVLVSDRHIRDYYEQLDEDGELAPPRVALAISADNADRVGYGKHTTQTTNINHGFAERLERAINRSGIIIDVSPSQIGTSVRGPAQDTPAPVLLPFKRRL